MTTPGATEAVTPDDLMRKLISRAHAPWDMLEPALAIIREAEANALRRAAEAQCDGCRLSGAPDRYGKHAEPTPIKCQALSIRSLLPKEEGK